MVSINLAEWVLLDKIMGRRLELFLSIYIIDALGFAPIAVRGTMFPILIKVNDT